MQWRAVERQSVLVKFDMLAHDDADALAVAAAEGGNPRDLAAAFRCRQEAFQHEVQRIGGKAVGHGDLPAQFGEHRIHEFDLVGDTDGPMVEHAEVHPRHRRPPSRRSI